MNIDLSNPIVLIIGGIALLALLYFWNTYNRKNLRNRKQRNFRESYYQRKKELEKDFEDTDVK